MVAAASTTQAHWKMTGSSYACTCTAFRSISTKLAARSSAGRRRSAVDPSAGGPPPPPPPVVMAGAVASPGKRMPPSPIGCTSRAATASSSRQAKEDDGASRNVSGFEPSIWGDFFVSYSSPLATSSLHKVYLLANPYLTATLLIIWTRLILRSALIRHACMRLKT